MADPITHLLIVDPQNDFCDLPAEDCPALPGAPEHRVRPALPVPGAHADLGRVAELIYQAGSALSAITITLDSHHHFDIGHPTFWRHGDGTEVLPFTQITAHEVRAGVYLPRQADALERVLAYLEALESRGRYRHMVWPVHCELGTWGHNVHHQVRRAYDAWEEKHLRVVEKVIKGTNPWTEHYSALRAEVPDPRDPATELNTPLVARLRAADRVLITGEAASHCVKSSTEDLVLCLDPPEWRKLVLVTDCTSAVPGFEADYASFLAAMQAWGVGLATSQEVLATLTQDS